jgi:hypothetical protein
MMNSAVKLNSEPDQAADLDRATYLWEEYMYRHDLILRLLFRITFVTVALSITPFTINDSVRRVYSSLACDLRTISQKKKGDIFQLIVFAYPAILLLLIALTFIAFVRTA